VILAFAGCEIDVERRELRREGKTVHVEPQVLDVLLLLIRHRDRVVTKDELIQSVWGGRFVSDATVTSRISAARRAIGDAGARQDCLRTVARRGFRFHAAVQERRAPQPPAIPAQPTSLIGREGDIAAVSTLLGPGRLVTLTGVGGVGKTRLALEIARRAAAQFPDGAILVELAPIKHPDAMLPAIAGVLGVSQQAGQTMAGTVVMALRARRLLLVVDNCEHLVDAVARLTHDILAQCPLVTMLATSREALQIAGEQVWPIAPLDWRGDSSPAARLFVERARAATPDFTAGADAAAIAEICRRVDGVPLAIELAAARIRSMSPSQIRDRLRDGIRLLSGGARSVDAKHLSLRRAMEWSYDLLGADERSLLEQLSVFAGGFTLEAAERVCGPELAAADVLELLDSLVRKSLVTVERAATAVRYGQLETIRQFGDERLRARGSDAAAARRHARFFAEDAETGFAAWRSRDQRAAYEWLDRELGNLRAAFRWACDHDDVDAAVRIASNIGDMGRFRMRDEAAAWAAQIVDRARAVRHRRLGVLLTWAASTAWSIGELDAANRYGEEAIALAGDDAFDPFVWAFTDLAMVASYQGDVTRAIELARRGAAHEADARDRFCLALAPYFLAVAGRTAEAAALAEEAVPAVQAAGVPSSLSAALWAKGRAVAPADPEAAAAAYDASIAVARESGNRLWEAMSALELAAIQAGRGSPSDALRTFENLIEVWRGSPDLIFISHGLGSVIVLFARLGVGEPAAVLHGAIAKLLESNPFVAELGDATTRVRRLLGDAAFDAASRRGAAMELHAVHDYALEHVRRTLRTRVE